MKSTFGLHRFRIDAGGGDGEHRVSGVLNAFEVNGQLKHLERNPGGHRLTRLVQVAMAKK